MRIIIDGSGTDVNFENFPLLAAKLPVAVERIIKEGKKSFPSEFHM